MSQISFGWVLVAAALVPPAAAARAGASQAALAKGGVVPSNELPDRLARFEEAYRRALVASQRGDSESTYRSTMVLETRWNEFSRGFGEKLSSPYDQDPSWREAIAAIGTAVEEARRTAQQGRPGEVHALLEPVRRVLRDLRRRNGVDSFDDRLTDFHDAMERVRLRAGSAHEAPWTDADRLQLQQDLATLAASLSELARAAEDVCLGTRELVREEEGLVAALVRAIETGPAEPELRQSSEQMHRVYLELLQSCR